MAVLTKITTRTLADNSVTAAKIQADTIVAGDLAPNSVGASELANDAVDTAAIADDAVTNASIADGAIDTAAKLGSNVVTTAKIANSTGASDGITTAKLATDAVTSAKIATGAVIADGIGAGAVVAAGLGASAVTKEKIAASAIEVKPHIELGLLYPAMKDTGGTVRLSDGVTAHSGNYGTAQSDGHKYYYTDIKGSRPIEDPRIGAHFGSQRHKVRSLQLLEQETATHGEEVKSVDGRKWMRTVGASGSSNYVQNNDHGNYLVLDNAGEWIEITGYFNDANILLITASDQDNFSLALNGTNLTANNPGAQSVTPLNNRYLDASSVINISFSTTPTLGINTIKITKSDWLGIYGIELIVQDTGSTARKSHVNIPAQNVVSYGKKFSVGSDTLTNAVHKHYDPFAFKTDGTTAWTTPTSGTNNHNGTSWPVGTGSSHNIDTATSLGLDKWLHSSNYYRPYNGGRVVIWVDSAGAIKTSVNVMPPNARSISTGAITAKANASVANTTYKPTFEAGAVNDFTTTALSEVAKTFNWREFGNGSANQGSDSSKADASMVNGTDDIGFVLDDGLTSLTGDEAYQWQNEDMLVTNTKYYYITFIGTGISVKANTSGYGWRHIAQNLPYGSHMMRVKRHDSQTWDSQYEIDGVAVNGHASQYPALNEVTFSQPKKPPIPDDACVLADYMLMADFVPISDNGIQNISKGGRLVCASRDMFHSTSAGSITPIAQGDGRVNVAKGNGGVQYTNPDLNEVGPQLTWFGDAKITHELFDVSDSTERTKQYFDGSTTNVTSTSEYSDSGAISSGLPSAGTNHYYIHGAKTSGEMGQQTSKLVGHADDTGNDWVYYACATVASPIHTSSHYQAFETPYLYELIGGDRNMEQTNLVVTADGKTWDEKTRDTSYIGSQVLSVDCETDSWAHQDAYWVFEEVRGRGTGGTVNTIDLGNKDWVPAWNKHVCLRDGYYTIAFRSLRRVVQGHLFIKVNGVNFIGIHQMAGSAQYGMEQIFDSILFKRGDYIQVYDEGHGLLWQHFYILRDSNSSRLHTRIR